MIYKLSKYKNSLGFGLKLMRSYQNGKFEALLVKLGRRGFWIFRDKNIYENWPATNG